ncbi:hypothetical protein [Rhodococcus jostii]|uniref:hypothetical protein n=1 Tax=Rhodococcus jostii TaxID=132919 RepID=UPI00362DD718
MSKKVFKCTRCNRRMRSSTRWLIDPAGVLCPDCALAPVCAPTVNPEVGAPLYRYDDNGEPYLSPKGMSVLLGVPLQEIEVEYDRHGTTRFAMPEHWIESGRRRTAEYKTETGRDDMLGALEYWARRDDNECTPDTPAGTPDTPAGIPDAAAGIPHGPLPSTVVVVGDDGVPDCVLDVDLIQQTAITLMYDMAANSGDQEELEKISARYLDQVGVEVFGYVTAAALKFMTSNVLEPTLEVLDALAPTIGIRHKLTESALNARLS